MAAWWRPGMHGPARETSGRHWRIRKRTGIRPRPEGTGPRLSAGPVSLPTRAVGPLAAVTKRVLLAAGLLVLSTAIIYWGRYGYRDAAHPGRPLSVLGCFYYSTVTLSTTGFGDIVPVTATARLVNAVVITPLRVMFLIFLVGTTLEVMADRTRANWRLNRWRSHMAGHTVIIGYGTKGRSAIRTLGQSGVPDDSIVVVDLSAEAVAEANQTGLAAVCGDGTRRSILSQAEVGSAAQIVIAVSRDDSAVLTALTARQLNPSAVIVAAVRENENRQLLRQSGADHVVVSSDTAGQMLAFSTVRAGRGPGDRRPAGARPGPRPDRAARNRTRGRSAAPERGRDSNRDRPRR